ncbi:MAG: hypothetical protein NUW08_03485, partial [Candidatus Uhrbacteria bacterium]|nr:hypothetical protein [Candidatus Uhrbacteria bacterium]
NPDTPCTTDADCGEDPRDACGGFGPFGYNFNSCDGVTVRRCSNDQLRSCTVDGDCGPGLDARCLSYPTSRVRTCKAYGGTDPDTEWCTWNIWSACEPTNYCGDGIVDDGEDCDDGNRSNNDACTNACRPNVCGDSFYYIGVEECDLGSANGTRSCTADYGSTCLSCSTSCRQVASSGGFCGNGVREGSEQCDGTEGLEGITCRSLGFDYAARTVCRLDTYCERIPGGSRVVVASGEETEIPSVAYAHSGGLPGTCASTPLSDPRSLCLTDSPARDVLTCSSSCGYSGCLRCGDEPGTGVISAQVFDAVYFDQPVPNARVTLYNRGVRVGDPTFTDGDGRFSFTTLNAVNECTNYRIIVDFYQDNPCTGARTGSPPPTCNGATPTIVPFSDEGVYGGYWPYESRTFGVSTFRMQGIRNSEGKIFLAPRVGPGETLVIHTWLGSLGGLYIDAHPVLPAVYEFRRTEDGPRTDIEGDDVYEQCEVAEDCAREINYGWQGNVDMNRDPHANLYCISAGESPIDGCQSFNVAPQTVKWKRDASWTPSGRYSYYLVNYHNVTLGSPNRSAHFFYFTSSTVRIITEDRMYAVDAPNRAPTCTDAPASGTPNPNKNGKYWLVFQQDAASGAVSFPSAADELRCRGQDSLTGHGTDLPQPMWDTGGD